MRAAVPPVNIRLRLKEYHGFLGFWSTGPTNAEVGQYKETSEDKTQNPALEVRRIEYILQVRKFGNVLY